MTVFAFDPERRTNAQLIADCHTLGYITDDDIVLDPTFGLGNWWKDYRPPVLVAHDLIADKAPNGVADFRALPYPDSTFTVVAFDPPYKYNGTPDPEIDHIYGVDQAATWQSRLLLMLNGLSECARVLERGGHLLAKCQAQVVSGQVRWQDIDLATWGLSECDLRLKDQLFVNSYRPQPAGRRQVHAARNYSSLLVFEKLKPTQKETT